MIPDVAKRADKLKGLCLRYRVSRLELFGSAATGQYHPAESDLDFVVEFQGEALAEGFSDAYFGLLEELEQLLGRSGRFGPSWHCPLGFGAGILTYFLQSVEESRTFIYEA